MSERKYQIIIAVLVVIILASIGVSYRLCSVISSQSYDAGSEDGYKKGYIDGEKSVADKDSVSFKEGYKNGYAEAVDNGELGNTTSAYNEGYKIGYDEGILAGYDFGYDDGYNYGYSFSED